MTKRFLETRLLEQRTIWPKCVDFFITILRIAVIRLAAGVNICLSVIFAICTLNFDEKISDLYFTKSILSIVEPDPQTKISEHGKH